MTAAVVHKRFLEPGVRIGENDRYRMRAVTHLDVTREEVEQAAEIVRAIALEGEHAV